MGRFALARAAGPPRAGERSRARGCVRSAPSDVWPPWARSIAAIALVAIILFGGGDGGYTVKATFINARPAREGQPRPGRRRGDRLGAGHRDHRQRPGRGHDRRSTGRERPAAARARTRAIRQFSQSGIANRYVDLDFPPQLLGARRSRTAGDAAGTDTTTQVDLDQLFNTLDPETRARRSRTSSRARPTSSGQGRRRPTRASSTSTPRSRPRAGCSASSTATRRCSSASWSTPRGWSPRWPSARRPLGAGRQPQHHHPRAGQPEGGARRVDRACCRRSCAAPTRPS